MRRVAITVATLFLAFGGIAQAKTFRVAGIYSDSMTGHFNCTCNQEAACMTRAVVEQAKVSGLDIAFKLVTHDRHLLDTVGAANQIAKRNYDAAIGALVSSDAIVASNVFEKAGIPFITPTATNPLVTEGKKFATRIPFNDYRQSHLLAKLTAREFRAKSVAVIRNTSMPYSDFLGKQFAIELKKLSPKTRIREFTTFKGFSDFPALIGKILADPTDVIFVPLTQASLANIYVALESKKAKVTLLSSDTIEGQPKFVNLLENQSGRIRFVYPKHWNDKVQGPESKNYLNLHKKHCSKYPHSMTTIAAYDAASVLVRALKKNPKLRGEKLVHSIKKTKYHGMGGSLVYGTRGDPVKPLELFELVGARAVHWRRWE